MEKLDVILDTVKRFNRHNKETFIEVCRSNSNIYNCDVTIKASNKKMIKIEVVGVSPNVVVRSLQEEYEYVKTVHVVRTHTKPKPKHNPRKPKLKPVGAPYPIDFNLFTSTSTEIYDEDENFAGFVFSPNYADPAVTLDKSGRLNPNTSAMAYMSLDYNDTFTLGYNPITQEIAIIPGTYGEGSNATYRLDGRNYASARYFADRYGFSGRKTVFKLVGTSWYNELQAFIFRLV